LEGILEELEVIEVTAGGFGRRAGLRIGSWLLQSRYHSAKD
jgi:hypothetical protein